MEPADAYDVIVCDRDAETRDLLVGVLADRGHPAVGSASADAVAATFPERSPTPILVAAVERLQRLEPLLERAVPERPMVLAIVEDGSRSRSLEAFRSGADAVLPQPIDVALFLAQVEALLLRDASRVPRLRFGGFILDVTKEVLKHDGEDVHLTATEFSLLVRLVRARGQVVTKADLAAAGWGRGYVAVNTIQVHVRSLRRKLERFEPGVLATVRGRGYRLVGA